VGADPAISRPDDGDDCGVEPPQPAKIRQDIVATLSGGEAQFR